MARARTPTNRGSTLEIRLRLEAIARNLWWSWNPDASRLLERLDPAAWRLFNHNPVAVLAELPDGRLEQLGSDKGFVEQLEGVERDWNDYLACTPWFQRAARARGRNMLAAYFCMEFGVHESLPLYAGGLGILAGDHVKSASDLGVPLVGIGILWKHGYYTQSLDSGGRTIVRYPTLDFERLPIDDTGKVMEVALGTHRVLVRIWCLSVGRTPVYLLDTDLGANSKDDRALTHNLYRGGDPEYRLRQELLLGVGGLAALDALRLSPTVFHLNEGHAAFAPLERLRRLVKSGVGYAKAMEAVRARSVFTTHTPVPEGNDRFDADLTMEHLSSFARDLKLEPHELLALGRERPDDQSEPFCMTVLALRLSRHANGVARLHGETSRAMWQRVFNTRTPKEVPIGHITNGVHAESWIGDGARAMYARILKPTWNGAGPDDNWWKRTVRAPATELWETRRRLRRNMIAWLRERLREEALLEPGSAPDQADLLDSIAGGLSEEALTIGFARRFATYKRAPLIFSDPRRLARLLSNADRPVQIIFAGKAHPQDAGGQEFVRQVHQWCRRPEFRGRVFLVQNYDMHVGRMLTSGCDVWLNNPVRPMEASGTSGMKSPLNLGINCSILDGWWPEACDGSNGFTIGGKQFADRAAQDRFDSRSLYEVLERRLIPLFYDRGRGGVPREWCRMMAQSMASIGAPFSAHRMVAEYVTQAYLPAHGKTTATLRSRKRGGSV